MTPEEELQRGNEAKRILNDAIYNEAYTVIRERIVQQLSQMEIDDAKRARLNSLLVAHETVRRYMEQVVMTGKMAAAQIERDRTFAERMRDKIRSVA